jgi:hypothetical protein
VCVNATQVCVNATQVCVNATQVRAGDTVLRVPGQLLIHEGVARASPLGQARRPFEP